MFRDLRGGGRFVERFIIESWAEYVRLRTRMTVADRRTLDALEAFQQADVPIRISRLIGIGPAEATAEPAAPAQADSLADDRPFH